MRLSVQPATPIENKSRTSIILTSPKQSRIVIRYIFNIFILVKYFNYLLFFIFYQFFINFYRK
jgi:hypothetical protein